MIIVTNTVDLYRSIGVTADVITSLISTDVENVYDDWDISTAYVFGDIVVWGLKQWTAAQDGTGIEPPSGDKSSLYWTFTGYANKYRMFDGSTTSQTEQDGGFTVTISANNVNSISFFRLRADSVEITMTSPVSGVVYSETFDTNLNTQYVTNEWEYCFLPFADDEATRDFSIIDLPPFYDAEIEVKFNSLTTAKVGMMSYGTVRDIGWCDMGTSSTFTDYSMKEDNDYGDVTIVERAYASEVDFQITLPRELGKTFLNIITSNRATPSVYIGDIDLEETLIYGFPSDYTSVISNLETTTGQLTITGL